MAGTEVREQLVEQIPRHAAPAVPQVMVRVADAELGLQRLLLHLREPLGVVHAATVGYWASKRDRFWKRSMW